MKTILKKPPDWLVPPIMSLIMIAGICLGQASAQDRTLPNLTGSSQEQDQDDVEIQIDDPISASQEVKAGIEIAFNRLLTTLDEFDKKMETLDLKKIQGQKIAVEELVSILDDLDFIASELLKQNRIVISDVEAYREAVRRAPAVFSAIAASMDDRTTEDIDPMLQDYYRQFSEDARNIAAAYVEKQATIDTLKQDVAQKMQFVVESRRFIADAKTMLEAIPTDYGLETEKWLARVNKYVEAFEGAIRAIKTVTGKIGEGATPPSIRSSSGSATGMVPAILEDSQVVIQALNPDEYMQQLAVLSR